MSSPFSRGFRAFPLFCSLLVFSAGFPACKMSGWDTDLEAFVDFGRTITYLESSSYVQSGGATNADVVPGTPVTVTVRLNNPKALALNYSISADSSFIDGTMTAPASTAEATAGITTVSFTFTPTAAAEHGDIEFRLGLSSPAINRTFAPAIFKVRCDSPPGPITVIKAGKRSDGKPCVAFMLPEDYADADIAAVEITYTNTSSGTSKTATVTVSRTGSELKTAPLPAPLGSGDGKYVRYFSPDDAIADNPYDFTVTPIDASGKKCTTAPITVSIAGNDVFLGYDPNGGTGSVAAVYGYNLGQITVAAGSSLSKPGYAFAGWTTNADGSGTAYAPGSSFTLGTTSQMLYAQWQNVTMEIGSSTQLAALASQPSLTGTYVLTADVDMSGITNFVPIGSSGNKFTGIFDGGGHTIGNLTTTTANGDAGLFGYISTGAVISNVRLKNVQVSSTGTGTGDDGIGGLVGENDGGTITRCSVSGTVSGYRYVGGLVGNNRAGATISECYSTATVTATTWAGGFAGGNWGTVSNCYARSSVTAVDYAGGLFGAVLNPSDVKKCYAASTVLSTAAPADVGGITGVIAGSVSCSDSFYDATISGCTDTVHGTATTTNNMKSQSTYSGWDFASIWTIDPDRNGGYPYLRNAPVDGPIVIPSGTSASALQSLLSNNLDGEFILTGPIDLSGYTWKPIGTAAVPFMGTFDGGNNAITGMTASDSTIYAPANPITGMFGWLGSRGIIKNVHLTGITVGGATNDNKGGLVGYNVGGTILRCSTSGMVTGDVRVGGLVGRNDGTVSECWSNAAVSGTYSGGLVGENYGTIENSYARGSVTAHWGGGLVGSNATSGVIRNCYAATVMIESGTILGNTTEGYFQGLIGNSTGTVQNSYFDSSKIATVYYQGHIAIASELFGTPHTSTDLKDSANFSTNYSGWDFSNVWTFTTGKNGGYPCLRYNEATTDVAITSQSGLDAIRSKLDGDYVLTSDITLSGYWSPIGSSGSPFSGSFDGQGHTITNLTINATSGSQALFAETAPSAVIINLGLKNVAVSSSSGECISAIAAINHGKLYRCWASGTVTGQFRVGGLVGKNELGGKIEECYSVVNVVTTTTSNTSDSYLWNIGSLVAANYGSVKNCYSRGTVTGYQLKAIGSFMGRNEGGGTVEKSYSTGAVTYTASFNGPGGFAGENDGGTLSNCFYDKDTTLMTAPIDASQKTTTQMNSLATFSSASWDIVSGPNTNNVWGIDTTKTINNGYPYLQYFGANTVKP